jgi:predicted membrane-bound mannosyltransferase
MSAAIWIFSLPLIAEFAMAPASLWTGRTMADFTAYAGLWTARTMVTFTAYAGLWTARTMVNFTAYAGPPAWSATRVLAPVKLAGAVLLAIGLGSVPRRGRRFAADRTLLCLPGAIVPTWPA